MISKQGQLKYRSKIELENGLMGVQVYAPSKASNMVIASELSVPFTKAQLSNKRLHNYIKKGIKGGLRVMRTQEDGTLVQTDYIDIKNQLLQQAPALIKLSNLLFPLGLIDHPIHNTLYIGLLLEGYMLSLLLHRKG